MRKVSLATLGVLLLAGSPLLRAADTAPAAASVKDFSTPKAAVKSFLQASYNQLDLSQPQDDAAVANTLLIPDAQKSAVTAILDSTSAQAKLERASADLFGATATLKALHDGGRDVLTARLKSIDSAKATVSGDNATLQIPEDTTNRAAAGTVLLRRVNGAWKIDAASLFSLTRRTPEQLTAQTDLLRKITRITNDITADVRAKKFSSPSDIYAELQTRIAQVLPVAPAAAKP
jgi:hypothetical protein